MKKGEEVIDLDEILYSIECCKVGNCTECDYCSFADNCQSELFNDIKDIINLYKEQTDKCKRCLFERKQVRSSENE